MKKPVYYRWTDYNLDLLPNAYLREQERGVGAGGAAGGDAVGIDGSVDDELGIAERGDGGGAVGQTRGIGGRDK